MEIERWCVIEVPLSTMKAIDYLNKSSNLSIPEPVVCGNDVVSLVSVGYKHLVNIFWVYLDMVAGKDTGHTSFHQFH